MDFDLFDDNNCISHVYGNIMPSFNDIEIRNIIIIPLEETDLLLKFDTLELPRKMPNKWLLKKATTGQIEIYFGGVNIMEFTLGKEWKYSFTLKQDKFNKIVVLKNKFDNSEICFSARLIYAKHISAYRQNI